MVHVSRLKAVMCALGRYHKVNLGVDPVVKGASLVLWGHPGDFMSYLIAFQQFLVCFHQQNLFLLLAVGICQILMRRSRSYRQPRKTRMEKIRKRENVA
jgi:hypothetical protein